MVLLSIVVIQKVLERHVASVGWLGSVQTHPRCSHSAFPSLHELVELHNAHPFNIMKRTCEKYKAHTLGKDAGSSDGGFACSQAGHRSLQALPTPPVCRRQCAPHSALPM